MTIQTVQGPKSLLHKSLSVQVKFYSEQNPNLDACGTIEDWIPAASAAAIPCV